MSKTKKIEPSHLTSHTGFWMRLISNNVSHSFARKLENSGVTVAEWVVLREMYKTDDVTSPGVIADITGLTRGAISKLVTRLLEKELVNRKEASGDRRYQDIKLTKKAINLIPALAKIADENDEFFFSALTRNERKTLTDTLIKLAEFHKLKTMPIE